jgi:ABC-2 type transport system ATP-binding protein
VLLSSHLLPEVEEICDWIIMIDRGRHLFEGPMTNLLSNQLVVRPRFSGDAARLADIAAGLGWRAQAEGASLVFDVDGNMDEVAAAVNHGASQHGIDLVEIHSRGGRLERTYLELVQGSLG